MIDFSCEYISATDNIKVTLDREVLTCNEFSYEVLAALYESLFWCDTYQVGEEWCASNYTLAVTLFNCNRDMCYVLLYSDLDALIKGEKSELTLKAYLPTTCDREAINEFLGD